MGKIRALVLGGTELFMHRTVVCLADADIDVSAVSQYRLSGLRVSAHVDQTFYMPWELIDHPERGLAEAVNDAARESGADIIFPTDVTSTVAVQTVEREIETPLIALPSPHAIATCADKARFSRFLASIGCPQPDSTRLLESLAELGSDTAFPLIVKPHDGGGGTGVARVDSKAALAAHVESGAEGTALPLLVQEFVPGSDIDCSFYAEDGELLGVAVQTRRWLEDPEVTFVHNPEVVEMCRSIVSELGYSGLGHADLRIDERDSSVRMIEINPRVWGSVNYSMWMGANFPAFAVHRALGLDPAPLPSPIGRCVQPSMDVRALMRPRQRRNAPSTLNPAERHAFETNHGDPWPVLTMQVRRRAEALWGALRSS